MAYTTIDNPELYFQCKIYTGTGSSNAFTLDGDEDMQPDLVWIKHRAEAHNHYLYDVVRGVQEKLSSNTQAAEIDMGSGSDAGLTAFGSDGFTIGGDTDENASGESYVAWNWKANGSGSSNGDGSTTSTVSVNTTAGFSIARFTGTGSNLTIGHGLGVKPDFIILKCDSSGSTDWTCYHSSLGATKRIKLNATEASSTNSTTWQDTEPTTSVISVGTSGDVNVSSGTHMVYSFAEKKGYSKFGSYVANGNSDNTFVYTGFKVAFLMTKLTSHSGGGWEIVDSKRDGYNGENNRLYPNDTAAEGTGNDYDLLSNGFKVRQSGGSQQSGRTNIYIAFAESPFVNSNGVPNNAR
jgi:hypothetical protein